jgi:hypothetical protein
MLALGTCDMGQLSAAGMVDRDAAEPGDAPNYLGRELLRGASRRAVLVGLGQAERCNIIRGLRAGVDELEKGREDAEIPLERDVAAGRQAA